MEEGYEPAFLPLRKPSRGQGLVEYALIIALLVLVCVVVAALSPAISSIYAHVTNTLSGTPPPAATPTLDH